MTRLSPRPDQVELVGAGSAWRGRWCVVGVLVAPVPRESAGTGHRGARHHGHDDLQRRLRRRRGAGAAGALVREHRPGPPGRRRRPVDVLPRRRARRPRGRHRRRRALRRPAAGRRADPDRRRDPAPVHHASATTSTTASGRDVVITYDLPGRPPRSAEPWRANEAFAAFVAYAYGDPGASTVRLVSPQWHQLDDPRPPRRGDPGAGGHDRTGDLQVMTFDALYEPGRFAPAVIATEDGSLTETVLDVNGRQVVLQAWPDDPEWTGVRRGPDRRRSDRAGVADRAADPGRAATRRAGERPTDPRGVRRLVRQPHGRHRDRRGPRPGPDVPRAQPRLVQRRPQPVSMDHRGPRRDVRQPGPRADAAGPSVRRCCRPGTDPGALALDDVGASERLRASTAPSSSTATTASYFVVDSVVDEIGIDRMGDVLAAVEGDLEAYRRRRRSPQSVAVATDWRRLLDLLDEVAGVGRAPRSCSARTSPPAGRPGVDRPACRPPASRYAALVVDGAGWAAPDVVRDAMEAWDFLTSLASVIDAVRPQCSPHGRRCGGRATRRASTCRADARGALRVGRPTRPSCRPWPPTSRRSRGARSRHVAAATDAAGQRRTTSRAPRARRRQFGDELDAARAAIAAGDAGRRRRVSPRGIVDEVDGCRRAAGQRRPARSPTRPSISGGSPRSPSPADC